MDNVAKALELDIPHMSLYSLILENHTVFMNRQRRGNLHLPNEDVESDMFDYILQELEKTASNTTRFPTSPSLVLKATTTSCTGTTPSITDWEQGLQATSTACVIATVPHPALPQVHPRKGHSRLHEEFLSKTEQMEEEMF